MPTELERLATLEAERPFIQQKLVDIEGKVDKLLDAHNRQKGMARLGNVLLNAVSAVAGVWAGIHWGKP